MPTKFQLRVFSVVKKIPRGKTLSYGEIAKMLKTSPRAVGQALAKNKDRKVLCHRVIMSSGKLGDYNRGKKLKEKLLKAEGAI